MSIEITLAEIKLLPFYIIKYLVKEADQYKEFTISVGVQGITWGEVDKKARKKLNDLYKEAQVTFVSLQHHDNLLML